MREKNKNVKSEKVTENKLSNILKNEYVNAILLYFIILVMLFYSVIFSDKSFTTPDQVSASYTFYSLKKHFVDGVYPLWNPYIFSGMPAFSALSFNVYVYLPNFILQFISMLGLPGMIPMVLHYLIAGFGTFLLLRRWGLKSIPAFFGGLAYMITPYLITMLVYGHGSQMMTAVYMPLAVWAIDRLLYKPGLFNMALTALILGIQLQRGHVQIAYYTWMLIGAYFIYFLIVNWRKENAREILLKVVPFFVISLVLAFCLSAVLYIPIHNYSKYSIRGGSGGGTGFDYATMWSFHPKEMMTFLNPSYFGFGGVTYWGTMPFTDYPNYMGILVLVLGVLAVFIKKRKITIFFITIAILSLLTAFGKHFFLYGLFYKILPFFSKFRVPSMILIVTQFCVAVLAAFGLNDLVEYISKLDEKGKKKLKKIIFIVFGLLGLFALYLLLFKESYKASMFEKFKVNPQWNEQQIRYVNNLRFDMLYRDFWLMILFLAAGLSVAYLFMNKKLSAKIFFATVVLVTFVDLYRVDNKIIRPMVSSRVDLTKLRDPACEYISKDKDIFRIYPLGNLFNDKHWGLFGLQSIGGYHPAKLKVYQDLMENVGFNTMGILRMLNVKYIISPARFSDDNFEELLQTTTYINGRHIPVAIYKFKKFLPRAFFCDTVQVVKDKNTIFNIIKDGKFDPERVSIIEEELQIQIGKPDTSYVSIEKWDIHSMTFTVYTNKPAFLVISEIYYPNGWLAYVDNNVTDIFKTNYAFRGIVVPAGKHTVFLRFRATDIYAGLIISVLSLLVIVTLLIVKRSEK